MTTKIHCIECEKEDFDKIPFEEIKKMVGWIEPPDTDDGTWDVTMSDEGIFTCKDQPTAQILASIEEVKAILMLNENLKK